jgi:hypothetical protein
MQLNKRKCSAILAAIMLVFMLAEIVVAYTCVKLSGNCSVSTPSYVTDTSAQDKLQVNVTGSNTTISEKCYAWCSINRTKGNITLGNFTGNYSDTSTFNYTYQCNHGIVCPNTLSCGLYYHSGTNYSVIPYGTLAAGGCNYSFYAYANGTQVQQLYIQKQATTGGESTYPITKTSVFLILGAATQMILWWKLRRT